MLEQNGMRAEMGRLTVARKIAAVRPDRLEERSRVRSEETELHDIAVPRGLPAAG